MKLIRRTFSLSLIALIVALPVQKTLADEAVINGGFESGSFNPGWTVVDGSDFTNIGPDSAFSHSGTYHINLGASGINGSLSQSFSTAAGSSYTLSFWLANDSSVAPNFFQALVNGVSVLTLTDTPAFGYANYSIANLVGTGSMEVLEFRYRNDADFFRLDDISMTTAVVPEVGSGWLVLLGLVGLILFRLRRSTAAILK